MIKLKSPHVAQITNMFLRSATLVAKLGLTLYMGRYFTFAAMGAYGLAFGTVMITTVLLGVRFDYIVAREIVGQKPIFVLAKMRDQAVFYGLNYLVLAVVVAGLMASDVTGLGVEVLAMILILAILESLANMTYSNMISLGHPLLANLLLFIRAGSWAIAIALLGLFVPSLRTAEAVLVAWIVGTTASLILTFWAWRHLPWRSLGSTPIDWGWIKKGVSRCFLIWLGALGITGGVYADRFIVATNLNLDLAGVVTFYASFTTALITLIQSGVLAFAYPRLILMHRNQDREEFWHEVRKSGWHVALFAGVIAVGIGITVPLIGHFFHRPLLVDEAPTLWLMLLGIWMQANALTLYYVLFARHQDRAIWLGGLLYLIPALGGNAVLVPLFGFVGIGYGSVIANLFLVGWRLWHVRLGTQKQAVA